MLIAIDVFDVVPVEDGNGVFAFSNSSTIEPL